MSNPPVNNHSQLLKYATYASVSVSLLLIGIKGIAWVVTGSVSMLSTLVDSCFDFLASLLNLLVVRYALMPADREHRFGHGKAEALSGLGQAAFVTGAATFVLLEATIRFFEPRPLHQEILGIWVMVAATFLTFVLIFFQQHVIRKTHSVAIAGDALHYRGDVLINVGVLLSLWIYYRWGLRWVDPLIGGAIAAYLLWNAWQIVQQALGALMDRELPDADRTKILAIARSHPHVLGVHDLRTRQAGPLCFIQLHLEMKGMLTLSETHQVTVEVEEKIREAFPQAEVITHQDPKGVKEKRDQFD